MTDNPLTFVIGLVLLAWALSSAILVRDPFLIMTPWWAKLLLAFVLCVGGATVIIVFFIGAIVCHGAC